MEQAKRFELMMKGVLIVLACVNGLAIVFTISGFITERVGFRVIIPFGMAASFTALMHIFSNEAIKALKQEIESLKSGSSES